MQVGLGSYYAWSVFREPLSSLYGAGITGVNTAFFLASVTFSFAALGAGFWMRRVSPRVVGVAGGSLYGLGVFLSSFAEHLPVLYLTYGLIAGIGLGFGYIAPVVTLPRWFPDRPGLAYGIAVCGFVRCRFGDQRPYHHYPDAVGRRPTPDLRRPGSCLRRPGR